MPLGKFPKLFFQSITTECYITAKTVQKKEELLLFLLNLGSMTSIVVTILPLFDMPIEE